MTRQGSLADRLLTAVAGLILLAFGGAGYWVLFFGIDKLDEFVFQNITYGFPGNPVIPEEEQRADYLWDTWLIIVLGGVPAVAATVAIAVWAYRACAVVAPPESAPRRPRVPRSRADQRVSSFRRRARPARTASRSGA